MRRAILILCALSNVLFSDAQGLMKISEVFNFDIGDEFQFVTTGTTASGSYTPISPNADRIRISGKYTSANSDSVFYIRFHDCYSTQVDWTGGPHLVYNFWTYTDTAFYTNPDSSIAWYDPGFQYDQYVLYDSLLCNTLVNGCAYQVGAGFEPDYYTDEYGAGIGHSHEYYYCALGRYWIANTLFYYKKGDITCGEPDITTVEIPEKHPANSLFLIIPNPVKHSFRLQNILGIKTCQITLSDISGQILLIDDLAESSGEIDISHLRSGIYICTIISGTRKFNVKLVKE